MQILNSEIWEMLVKQEVEIVQTKTNCPFFSHLFVRPKNRRIPGMRPLSNLKALNQLVAYTHFKIKVNLKDAYLCITTCKDYREYLRFQYKGLMLQYNGLPFGLASGLKLFITKMMKPSIALVRRIGVRLVMYLYDIVLLHCKSITGRALKRQRNTFMVASQSRLVNKLEKKISPKPMPATIISGSNNKFIENGNNS